ncbi:MAG: flagellar basal body L-ring protein FlgH [Planctomycetes bacterium]|nr:flagellar basal body L-ring protein FlgH [Planctomycetota bacterium]
MTKISLLRALLALLALASLPSSALALLQGPVQGRRGSIYDPDQGPYGLIANKVGSRVGDLVTIVINESQDVKNEESSDLSKQTNLSYKLNNFDIKPNAFSTLPGLDASSDDGLKGTANYKKKGTFIARVTAVVVDVLPNGNLVVNGRREIRIDKETKLIEFSGILRRYDIGADNSIASELVANAKVSYVGTGPLTDSTNRKGLGALIHSAIAWVWPF